MGKHWRIAELAFETKTPRGGHLEIQSSQVLDSEIAAAGEVVGVWEFRRIT